MFEITSAIAERSGHRFPMALHWSERGVRRSAAPRACGDRIIEEVALLNAATLGVIVPIVVGHRKSIRRSSMLRKGLPYATIGTGRISAPQRSCSLTVP